MFRALTGIIVGLIVLFITKFVSMTGAWMVLGEAGTFEPGSFDMSSQFTVVHIITSFIAALVGGAACAMVAGRRGPAVVFAWIVLIALVIGGGAAVISDQGSQPRVVSVEMIDAMTRARGPMWVHACLALAGFFGALLGSRMKAKAPAAQA